MIRINPNELNETMIREMVEKQTGLSLGPDLKGVEIYELDRSENIEARLVALESSEYRKD
jgi:hypothetical protein